MNFIFHFFFQYRENFLMCSELEENPEEAKRYYNASKTLKTQISDVKRQIKSIKKRIDDQGNIDDQ